MPRCALNELPALGLIDIFQIHWPVNFAAVQDKDAKTGIKLEPAEDGIMLLDKDLSLVDTWKELIAIQKSGKVKRYLLHCSSHCRRFITNANDSKSLASVSAIFDPATSRNLSMRPASFPPLTKVCCSFTFFFFPSTLDYYILQREANKLIFSGSTPPSQPRGAFSLCLQA